MPRVLINTAFHNIRFKCQRCGTCCHHKRPEEFGDLVPMERLKEFWEKSNLIYLDRTRISRISVARQALILLILWIRFIDMTGNPFVLMIQERE